jgi:hypothetical protein
MQNQPRAAGPDGLAPFNSSLATIAHPKVVLLAAGLVGLAIDLFVRPLSWVGLALIVLATAPWMLQAWSERFARKADGDPGRRPAIAGVAASPAKPHPDQRIVSAGPKPGPAAPERTAPAAAPSRPPAAAGRAAEGDLRPAPARPQRMPEPAPAARPVKPETTR